MTYCLIIALVEFPVTSSQELCPCLSPPKGHAQDTAECNADTAEKTATLFRVTRLALWRRGQQLPSSQQGLSLAPGVSWCSLHHCSVSLERASSALCLHPVRIPLPPEMGGQGGKGFVHLRGEFVLCLHEVLLFLPPNLPHGTEYCSPFIKRCSSPLTDLISDSWLVPDEPSVCCNVLLQLRHHLPEGNSGR